ncbi:MAG: hypothetical protein KBE65_14205 [Phycisphaerae bacterium]|nr:hypothetical protein [Phycisphaerae bacterium]
MSPTAWNTKCLHHRPASPPGQVQPRVSHHHPQASSPPPEQQPQPVPVTQPQPLHRTAIPIARISIANAPGKASSNLIMVMVITLAIIIFLLAALIILKDPLDKLADVRLAKAKAAQAQQEHEARKVPLRESIETKLAEATHALEELQNANDLLVAKVEAKLGRTFESAIPDPPAALRRATIDSPAVLHPWTTLINTILTPEQVSVHRDVLTTAATALYQENLSPALSYNLQATIHWAVARKKAIETIDPEFLNPYTPADPKAEPSPAPTERR